MINYNERIIDDVIWLPCKVVEIDSDDPKTFYRLVVLDNNYVWVSKDALESIPPHNRHTKRIAKLRKHIDKLAQELGLES